MLLKSRANDSSKTFEKLRSNPEIDCSYATKLIITKERELHLII